MERLAIDKLERLQVACQEKLRRIEVLKIAAAENVHKLAGDYSVALSSHVKIFRSKESQAEQSFDERQTLLQKHNIFYNSLIERIRTQQAALLDSFAAMKDVVDKLPHERRKIAMHYNMMETFIVQRRETASMAEEEIRSYRVAIYQATVSSDDYQDRSHDWYRRLLLATQIQRQEAERILTEQEAEYWNLSQAKDM